MKFTTVMLCPLFAFTFSCMTSSNTSKMKQAQSPGIEGRNYNCHTTYKLPSNESRAANVKLHFFLDDGNKLLATLENPKDSNMPPYMHFDGDTSEQSARAFTATDGVQSIDINFPKTWDFGSRMSLALVDIGYPAKIKLNIELDDNDGLRETFNNVSCKNI